MTTPLPTGDDQELSPALAALQSIKYDDGTPEGRQHIHADIATSNTNLTHIMKLTSTRTYSPPSCLLPPHIPHTTTSPMPLSSLTQPPLHPLPSLTQAHLLSLPSLTQPPLLYSAPSHKHIPSPSPPSHDHPDRALAFKEEGNALFRRREYRAAVKAYSEGLAAKAQDSVMNAVLYTNRANAQHNLGELPRVPPSVLCAGIMWACPQSATAIGCRELPLCPDGLCPGSQVQSRSGEGHLQSWKSLF